MRPIRFHAFAKDDRGAVAALTAIVGAAAIGFGAMALDSGLAYTDKRRLQTATDFAALAAASSLANSTSAASSSVSTNGYPSTDIAIIEPGIYTSDANVPAAQRFQTATAATANAVRVTMEKPHSYLFGKVIGLASGGAAPGDPTITTRSIAAARQLASFSIGSGLASLNGGVANSLLSSLTGSSVSLSVMDYQSLANTSINLFTFSNALAARANLSAGNYDSLAAGNVALPAAIAAVLDAGGSSSSAAALAAIVAAVGQQTSTLKLSQLVNFGPYGSLAVGSAGPITASVSALSLISAILQASNGQHQAETALSVGLPGIVSASVKVSVGEPVVGSGLIAVGPQNTALTTAQTRLRLTLQLGGPAPANILNVPIVLSIANAQAVLNSVQCSGGLSSATVQLGVTPGVVDAYIGSVTDQQLADFTSSLNPPAATFLNILGLLNVTGYAHVSIANANPTPVSFTYADIQNATGKAISTTDLLSPLVSALINNLQVNVSVGPLSVINVGALKSAILQAVLTDAGSIDTILSSVLMTMGVSVGNATVWATGVQCGQAVLVN